MGILNLKFKTAYKYIKKQQKNTSNLENNITSQIRTVGIIAEANLFKAYDFTKRLSEDLGIDKNNIKVVLFDIKNDETPLENYKYFYENSFGMYGKIKDEDIKIFVGTSFDLLINYCAEETIYSQVIAYKSKAKLKISFENEYASFYNLSVNISENKIDTFNKEIIKYLQILNLLN